MTIRRLEDQFEPRTVSEIRKISKAYQELRVCLKGESAGYLISGIRRSLEAGIVLGALSLSFTLLEMFLHDLVIAQCPPKNIHDDCSNGNEPWVCPGHARLPFERHLHAFIRKGLIQKEDGRQILGIYRKTGVPLHHIFSRRITQFSKPLVLGEENLLDRLLHRSLGEIHRMERIIEDYALETLWIIATFIERYRGLGVALEEAVQ